MRTVAAGALLGLVTSAGLVLVISWLLARRPAGVAERIRPFVGHGASVAPRPSRWDLPGLMSGMGSAGDSRALSTRLARAGLSRSAADYRLEQVAWAAGGMCAGGLVALVLGSTTPINVIVLSAVGAVAGALARDWRLARLARRRRERIDEQLPAMAELLAFAVAAGESVFSALTRASRSMDGDLADELAHAVTEVAGGTPLRVALMGIADRTGSDSVRRFVDGLVLAIDRGTPLVEVLRAQAADAQAVGRRRLMELAGRKDVAMLIPVVFLVLPTVVAVALFPGLKGLGLVMP